MSALFVERTPHSTQGGLLYPHLRMRIAEGSFGEPVEELERLGRVPRQAAGMRNVPGKAAVLLMAVRTAAVSQDLDLREGVLFAGLLRAVSHDHELNGNEGKKRITDEDQRELNHDGTPLLCGVPTASSVPCCASTLTH